MDYGVKPEGFRVVQKTLDASGAGHYRGYDIIQTIRLLNAAEHELLGLQVVLSGMAVILGDSLVHVFHVDEVQSDIRHVSLGR